MTDKTFSELLNEIDDIKELEYVKARVSGLKPAPSARIAGLDHKHAKRYEIRPHIRAAIDAHRDGIRDEIKITHDDVTKMLKDALPMVASATEQVQVAQAIAKHMGFDVERTIRIKAEVEKSVNISGHVDVNQVHSLSEEELIRLAGLEEVPWIEGEAEDVTIRND
jgi:phage terminase small subunit